MKLRTVIYVEFCCILGAFYLRDPEVGAFCHRDPGYALPENLESQI